jgi:hypothetical protein
MKMPIIGSDGRVQIKQAAIKRDKEHFGQRMNRHNWHNFIQTKK